LAKRNGCTEIVLLLSEKENERIQANSNSRYEGSDGTFGETFGYSANGKIL
jgi:hypothetical protein